MSKPLTEEVLDSKLVFQGRLLTLRVDTVRLPNGVESTREVVVHPGAVAMVPVLDDRVVLVRQWRTAAGRALLEIPAGTLGPGEDPREAAARELMEEIGYRPRTLEPMFSTYLAPGYSSELLHVFLARDLVAEKMPHDDEEDIEVVTLTWNAIDDLLLRGEFADVKTISGLLMARKLLQH